MCVRCDEFNDHDEHMQVQCSHIIRAISLQSTSSTTRWWVSCTLRATKRGDFIVHRLAIMMTASTVWWFCGGNKLQKYCDSSFVVVIFAPMLLSPSVYGKSHWSMRKKRLHNKFIWWRYIDAECNTIAYAYSSIAAFAVELQWTAECGESVGRPESMHLCKVLRELEIFFIYASSFSVIFCTMQYTIAIFVKTVKWKRENIIETRIHMRVHSIQARVSFYMG